MHASHPGSPVSLRLLLVATGSSVCDRITALLSQNASFDVHVAHTFSQALAALQQKTFSTMALVLPFPVQEALALHRYACRRFAEFPLILFGQESADIEWPQAGDILFIQLEKTLDRRLAERIASFVAANRRARAAPSMDRLHESLSRLTPILFTEYDLDALLQRVIEEAVELVPSAQAGSILMAEEEGFAFRGFLGFDSRLRTVKIPADDPFVAMLREGKTLHIHQIARHTHDEMPDDIGQLLRDYGRAAEIQETLATPLIVGGELIGYLTVDSLEEGITFSMRDHEALRYLAGLATIAIHNTQLLQAEHDARSLAETLQSLSATLVASLNVQDVLGHLLDATFKLTPCDAADVLLVHGENAYVAYHRGYEQFGYPTTREDVNFSLRDTVNLRAAAESHAPLLIRDTCAYPYWVKTPGSGWIRSHVAAPIFIDHRLVGFLNVISADPGRFTEKDRATLAALAPVAAIALRNAQLFEKEHTARQLAETLQKIGANLTRTLDERAIIETVAKEVSGLLPFHSLLISQIEDRRRVMTLYSEGLHPETKRRLDAGVHLDHFPIWRKVHITGAGYLIANSEEDERWVNLPGVSPISAIVVPVRSQDDVAGFLTLIQNGVNAYSEKDLASLQSLADLLGVALTNARLLMEAQLARRRVEAAYEDLRRLDSMKSQFIQNVSHELRTPLAIVKGYLDLVLDATFGFTLDPTIEQSLKAMQTHTNRLAELVESITTLENVETGQLQRQAQPILPVFLRAIQAIRQKAARHNLEIITDLPMQLPLVNVDPQQMGLALWHLLDNAIKFNKPGGRIWLRAWTEGQRVLCLVRDEGIGIEEEEYERIFDRFYQIDGSTKRRYEGMGLGLSIVKEVVEKHGGTTLVRSPGPHLGTTFTISLPVYAGGGDAR